MAPRKTTAPKRPAHKVPKEPVREKFIASSEHGGDTDVCDTMEQAKQFIEGSIDEGETYYIAKVIFEATRTAPPIIYTDFK
jgi:hypothetical protein